MSAPVAMDTKAENQLQARGRGVNHDSPHCQEPGQQIWLQGSLQTQWAKGVFQGMKPSCVSLQPYLCLKRRFRHGRTSLYYSVVGVQPVVVELGGGNLTFCSTGSAGWGLEACSRVQPADSTWSTPLTAPQHSHRLSPASSLHQAISCWSGGCMRQTLLIISILCASISPFLHVLIFSWLLCTWHCSFVYAFYFLL